MIHFCRMCLIWLQFILSGFNTTRSLPRLQFFTSQCSLSPPEGTELHTTTKTCRSQTFCQHFTLVADFLGLLHVNETTSKLRFFLKILQCATPQRSAILKQWLRGHRAHPKGTAERLPSSCRTPRLSISLRRAPRVPRRCLLLPESPDGMVCPHSSAGTRPAPVLAASAHLQFIFLGYN